MPEIHPPEGMQSRIKPFDLNDAEITPFRPSMAGMAEDCAQLRERIRFLEKELQKKDYPSCCLRLLGVTSIVMASWLQRNERFFAVNCSKVVTFSRQ